MLHLPFFDLFYDFQADEAQRAWLSGVVITHGEFSRDDGSVLLRLDCAAYASDRQLDALEKALREQYSLRRVELIPHFPAEALPGLLPSELGRVLSSVCPSASFLLAGCRFSPAPMCSRLQLLTDDAQALVPFLPIAERYIFERFGVETHIELETAEQASPEALFARTEALRRDAMRDLPAAPPPAAATASAERHAEGKTTIFGKPFSGSPVPMEQISVSSVGERVIVEGKVFFVDHREVKNGTAYVISFDMTDYTNSVRIHSFMKGDSGKPIVEGVKVGQWLRVQARVDMDDFTNELVLKPFGILPAEAPVRVDTATDKRVELHLHTTMSMMDALTKTGEAVRTAARWGHKAIAITDHGVVSSFPDALKESKAKVAGTDTPIKILYGCEGYLLDMKDERIAARGQTELPLSGDFIAFDLETTGLSRTQDAITEFGAVRFHNGEAVEEFCSFSNPKRRLTQENIDLTGITDEMLEGAPELEEVFPQFLRFCGDLPLVAHNADFDIGFLDAAARRLGIEFSPTYIDTLVLARKLLPELKKHKLDVVAQALKLPEFQHHRASDDAKTCGLIYAALTQRLMQRGVSDLAGMNAELMSQSEPIKLSGRRLQARHILIFAKNQTGLRNLYRLLSDANLNYFYRKAPCIPRFELERFREGLILGSACEAGELFQAVLAGEPQEELLRVASFYDFLEIQPLSNNRFLVANGKAKDDEQLRDFNRTIVRLGEMLGKPVCATGDVHFLNPEEEIYRRILLASKNFPDCDRDNPLYFRTTDEMLAEFSYLGEEKAREVVITNPNHIADLCDRIRPVPRNLFAPKIENSVEDLNALVYGKLHRLYGDNPPELIVKRVETEMHDIISCHYDVIYMSAQKLVQNSLENGYLVGSRGSVGSSLVAYMSGITEVNSLPAHYRCPKCKYCSFDVPAGFDCGPDLPDATCPECGATLEKDGFNIPFETFLGFGGDKVPDIDLNFSGEYQARAHQYCVEMFGASHVFRAGTIGTVAEKTAYGYVKKYLSEREKAVSRAEENRLAAGCVDVRRTTGQHPGGLVVIPQENEIWDFCPVQHPADNPDSDIITTHFEYHSMEENLLKLDMLGHDDPTMIRMLEDMTGVDAKKIPLDDKDTMSIFSSSKILGYENDPVLGPTGAVAIPEFNTKFTRQMLEDTHPQDFNTLVRLSGFSHGTDVWTGNARDLILSGTASVLETVGCRDDIMLYLISRGMPEKRAFKIMEAVRKGRGLPEGAEQEMLDAGVPQWYIESCKKIKYLFPKAHAVAYVMMAFRIAWFKVHYPLAFYAAYFYRRSQKDGFDAVMMTHGLETVQHYMDEINANQKRTAKDDDLLTTLLVCYEFYLRGFDFAPMDLYESHATKFLLKDGRLLPPFSAVSGLGETAAWDICNGREGRHFLSVEEFSDACKKVSKTHIESLRQAGALGDLPETNQITLF